MTKLPGDACAGHSQGTHLASGDHRLRHHELRRQIALAGADGISSTTITVP